MAEVTTKEDVRIDPRAALQLAQRIKAKDLSVEKMLHTVRKWKKVRLCESKRARLLREILHSKSVLAKQQFLNANRALVKSLKASEQSTKRAQANELAAAKRIHERCRRLDIL